MPAAADKRPIIPQYPVTARAAAMRIFQTRSFRSNRIACRRDGKAFSTRTRASGDVPAAEAERPLSVQSGDPRGDAGQWARRADSEPRRPQTRPAAVDPQQTLTS